jgi:hypothetical protein
MKFPRPAGGVSEDSLRQTAADQQKQRAEPKQALDPKRLRVLSPPRFAADDSERWLAYLDKNGYVVISSVCDESQIKDARSLMWDFLESVPGTEVNRDDIKSWGGKGDWMPSTMNGIVHGFGFGQSAFAWYLRELPAVKEVFAASE